MRVFLLLYSLCFLIISSCSTKKNLIYLQDIEPVSDISFEYSEYKLQVDDVLKINIGSEVQDAASIFNPNNNINTSKNKESLLYDGYQINPEGFITFPAIGKIYALNKTVSELTDIIHNKIIESDILTSLTVDIKILNTYFIILGEVNSPGRYDYLKNNINILEAIGIAGDLTINGVRKDVKLIRQKDNVKKVFSLDLTDTSVFVSEGFQILSGDIIIVNPNLTRVKNAGIIGNSGTLLSLLSFILSSIIVINN